MCAKFQQKILNSMVGEACQSFQFLRQKKPGFLEIIDLCQFKYQILHNLISITKL